jgi:deazaflavin-dependent oxidoreductase (nitroreductase family)
MAEMNDWNQKVIEEFRANGGKVGGQFAGAPLLLLTTIGAKSGRRNTTPVMYLADGDRLHVFASKGGAPTHPAWYHNLIAHPTVTVEVGSETFEARAVEVTGAERDRLYSRQAQVYPGFAEYAAKTTRQIPVVALERAP